MKFVCALCWLSGAAIGAFARGVYTQVEMLRAEEKEDDEEKDEDDLCTIFAAPEMMEEDDVEMLLALRDLMNNGTIGIGYDD